MNVPQIARYLWASPTTLVGLTVTAIACGTGGRCVIVDGVLETHAGSRRGSFDARCR